MNSEIVSFPIKYNSRYLYRDRVIDVQTEEEFAFYMKSIQIEEAPLVAEMTDYKTKEVIDYRMASCHDGVWRLVRPIKSDDLWSIDRGNFYFNKYCFSNEKISKLKNFYEESILLGTEKTEVDILTKENLSRCVFIQGQIYIPTLPPSLAISISENRFAFWSTLRYRPASARTSPLFWHELIDQEIVVGDQVDRERYLEDKVLTHLVVSHFEIIFYTHGNTKSVSYGMLTRAHYFPQGNSFRNFFRSFHFIFLRFLFRNFFLFRFFHIL